VLTLIALLLALLFLPSPWNVIVVVVAALIDLLETGTFLWWSRRRRRRTSPSVGAETIVGRGGVALAWIGPPGAGPQGQVRVDGEIWNARSAEPIDAGTDVTVLGVDGLTLDVAAQGGEADG
jgi:membrane protein implicated in regulation of membrane protease activity